MMISPFMWFEMYDDATTAEALHEDISAGVDAYDLDDIDV